MPVAGQHAVDRVGVDCAEDDVLRHRAGAADRQAAAAPQADGQRRGGRHRVDRVARHRQLVALELQHEAGAVGCGQHPALARLERGQLELLDPQPGVDVAIVLGGQIGVVDIGADVAVHPAQHAVRVGAGFDRGALAQVGAHGDTVSIDIGGLVGGRGGHGVEQRQVQTTDRKRGAQGLEDHRVGLGIDGRLIDGIVARVALVVGGADRVVGIVLVGLGRIVQAAGGQRTAEVDVEQPLVAGQRIDRDVAVGGGDPLVCRMDRRIDDVVDVVEGQRQPDRDGRAGGAAEAGGQRRRAGHRIDSRCIVGQQAHLPDADAIGGGVGAVAGDRGRDVGADPVLGVDTGAADGQAGGAPAAQRGRSRHHHRVDRAVGTCRQRQRAGGVDAGIDQRGAHLRRLHTGIDMLPQAGVAVLLRPHVEVLVAALVGLAVTERRTDVFIDVAGQRAVDDAHLQARGQRRLRHR